MDPQDLRRAIKESREKGFVPFFVNATAGTTVLGSIDPLGEIADICEEENLWLHVDVCKIMIENSSSGFFFLQILCNVKKFCTFCRHVWGELFFYRRNIEAD